MNRYRTIVADPPWPYSEARSLQSGKSTQGLRAHDYYTAMTMSDLCTAYRLALARVENLDVAAGNEAA